MWKLCLLYIYNTYNSYFGEPWEGGRVQAESRYTQGFTNFYIYLSLDLSIQVISACVQITQHVYLAN